MQRPREKGSDNIVAPAVEGFFAPLKNDKIENDRMKNDRIKTVYRFSDA